MNKIKKLPYEVPSFSEVNMALLWKTVGHVVEVLNDVADKQEYWRQHHKENGKLYCMKADCIWHESQEPKETCPECHYPKGVAHSRKCSLRRDGLVGETEEKVHSDACADSPLRECNPNCPAKPQDEPKECCYKCIYVNPDGPNYCGKPDCPCHQESETEGPTVDEQLVEAVNKEKYIILPRPKGMSIDEVLYKFFRWWEGQYPEYVDDEKFTRKLSEFLKSLEK